MSHDLIIDYDVDIRIKPKLDPNSLAASGKQITLGDLHANALKLLYILVRHGYIETTDEHYNQFKALYQTPVEDLTQDDVKRMQDIVNQMVVPESAKGAYLRFIGDMLADRGSNDYFVLLMLEKLAQSGVELDIIYSNHDAIFISACEVENDFGRVKQNVLEKGHPKSYTKRVLSERISTVNMQTLIDKGLVDHERVISLYQSFYKPNLKFYGYSYAPETDKLTVYSHAPNGLDEIRKVAIELRVKFDASTNGGLAQTIDLINLAFEALFIENKMGEHNVSSSPLRQAVWNRDADDINRPENICFVHGHDMHDPKLDNVFNLDNNLGKSEGDEIGVYEVLYSDDKLSIELALTNDVDANTPVHTQAVEIAQVLGDLEQGLSMAVERPNSPASIVHAWTNELRNASAEQPQLQTMPAARIDYGVHP